jgi:hypothetical protein
VAEAGGQERQHQEGLRTVQAGPEKLYDVLVPELRQQSHLTMERVGFNCGGRGARRGGAGFE